MSGNKASYVLFLCVFTSGHSDLDDKKATTEMYVVSTEDIFINRPNTKTFVSPNYQQFNPTRFKIDQNILDEVFGKKVVRKFDEALRPDPHLLSLDASRGTRQHEDEQQRVATTVTPKVESKTSNGTGDFDYDNRFLSRSILVTQFHDNSPEAKPIIVPPAAPLEPTIIYKEDPNLSSPTPTEAEVPTASTSADQVSDIPKSDTNEDKTVEEQSSEPINPKHKLHSGIRGRSHIIESTSQPDIEENIHVDTKPEESKLDTHNLIQKLKPNSSHTNLVNIHLVLSIIFVCILNPS